MKIEKLWNNVKKCQKVSKSVGQPPPGVGLQSPSRQWQRNGCLLVRLFSPFTCCKEMCESHRDQTQNLYWDQIVNDEGNDVKLKSNLVISAVANIIRTIQRGGASKKWWNGQKEKCQRMHCIGKLSTMGYSFIYIRNSYLRRLPNNYMQALVNMRERENLKSQ